MRMYHTTVFVYDWFRLSFSKVHLAAPHGLTGFPNTRSLALYPPHRDAASLTTWHQSARESPLGNACSPIEALEFRLVREASAAGVQRSEDA